MTGWRDNAQALFGEEWIAALSVVAQVPQRRAQRWVKADAAPPDVVQWLFETRRIVHPNLCRAYGDVLRAAMKPGYDHAARVLELALADVDGGRLP